MARGTDSDWEIEVTPEAEAVLAALAPDESAKVRRGIDEIPTTDAERLPGQLPRYRGYVGRWRVDFTRDTNARRGTVLRITEDRAWVSQQRAHHRRLLIFGLPTGMMVAAFAVIAVLALIDHRPAAPAGTAVFTEPAHGHVTSSVRYDRTPPAGGPHAPVWATCGVYTAPLSNEQAVHSLEHGAVWITYQPGLTSPELAHLTILAEDHYLGGERYVLLSPFAAQASAIVATAWGAQLNVSSPADPRLAVFLDHFRAGPQALEPGAYCVTHGVGQPAR